MRAPLMEVVGQNRVNQEWSACSWRGVGRVVTWWSRRGAHATAPLAPATPGHVFVQGILRC